MRQLTLFAAEPQRSEPRVAFLPEPEGRTPLFPEPWPPLFPEPRPALPAPDSPEADAAAASAALADRLADLLREPVLVELTDNAWTMVSYRRVQGRLLFRLHHMFAAAEEPLLRSLAGFTGKNRRAHGRAIDEYVRQNRALIKQSAPRADARLSPRGRVHDLADLYAEINARHFENQVVARIGWGRRVPQGRRCSIKMGVYFHDQKVIRLHPALDDERVPRHFVEMVVFHEMLHQVHPPRLEESGRRLVHGPEFRAAERRFPGYERARAWEKAHLHLLLRQRPQG